MSVHSAYLVGIKGVALTALAQIYSDMGWSVGGSDIQENFVTQDALEKLGVTIDTFSDPIPKNTDLVVYTAAHKGSAHPQVVSALSNGIHAISHAEALGEVFNQQFGIAVCGVGGKSTTSAMIAWTLEQAGIPCSYAVGVGTIIGLGRSGKWRKDAQYFVAEADEYAADTAAIAAGKKLVSRFSYLKPKVIVANPIVFDHPDVYRNLQHTREVFAEWFSHLSTDSMLISHDYNRTWLDSLSLPIKPVYFGRSSPSVTQLQTVLCKPGETEAVISDEGNLQTLKLAIPGEYNIENALGAFTCARSIDIVATDILHALRTFQSTNRRFEHKGKYGNLELYDDYAHHPRELKAVITAARCWAGNKKLLVIFQPHTFSRTQALWDEFVQVLSELDALILLKIFASARESYSETITAELLADAIKKSNHHADIETAQSIEELAKILSLKKEERALVLTVGAGDVYHVHELLVRDTKSIKARPDTASATRSITSKSVEVGKK